MTLKSFELGMADGRVRAAAQALAWVQARPYHTVLGNCIQFADWAVRLLTGGAVRGAPLAFDALAGVVPPAAHPMLAMLALTLQMTWYELWLRIAFCLPRLSDPYAPRGLYRHIQYWLRADHGSTQLIWDPMKKTS